MPAWDSWFGGGKETVAHQPAPPQTPKGDVAPAPQAMPVPPVQSQTVAPLQAPVPASPAATAPTPPTLQNTAPLNKIKVGILLPMSGPNAGLGHAMLNAAQQAVYDAAAPNFELMPRDTAGNEATAAAAAHDAIKNGATLLIGPLFAAQVPAVAKVAAGANVPVLTLSTDTSLASSNLYVMGFTPASQAERIARYAVSRGLKRFAALVPGNTYGALVGQAFQLEVAKDGGTMVAMDTYDPTQHDSDAKIRDIADKIGVTDALFLPEGGSDLALITKQLTVAGVDPQKVRILGTGLWDSYDTGHVAPFVVGGWYAASDPTVREAFVATYKSFYSEEPPRLSTLAYDATALAAALAKRGAHFDVASLTNPNGFAGLDGIFRLKLNGEVERGLAVLKVTNDGADVIDSAPPSFISSH